MLSLRNRFGIPGVISVLALVFALVGGAYAANGDSDSGATASAKKKNRKGNAGLSGKQKKQVTQIARREAKKFQGTGPAGPQGLPGATGAQGPKGDKGSKGDKGNTGNNGESVALAAATGCAEGGTKLSVGGESQEVCNGEAGENGETGFTSTLPSGKTETGGWSVIGPLAGGPEKATMTASFAIPLAAEIESGNAHFVKPGEAAPAGCTGGTPTEPKAEPGHLCVFAAEPVLGEIELEPTMLKIGEAFGTGGAAKVGSWTTLTLSAEVPAVSGSWAVTAP